MIANIASDDALTLPLAPAIDDRDVLALDIARVFEALAKCSQALGKPSGDVAFRKPTTGIAPAARAASGHAAAAPASSVMNSRRLMFPSVRATAWSVCRTHSLS